MRALGSLTLVLAGVAAVEAAQSGPRSVDLSALLGRVTARVEEFYARARTVTSTETVRFQQLKADFQPDGLARRLVYDLRLAWEPSPDGGPPPEASVLRQLLTVNGRPPRPRDEPHCTDPKDVAPDTLSMFLPPNRDDYEFAAGGEARVDNRASVIIEFRSVSKEPPEVEWDDDCVRVSVPGLTRGRIWIDAATHDVLRLDEHLTRFFDFRTSTRIARLTGETHMALERYDSSIRYRAVKFEDPDEILTLPRVIETTTVWRGGGTRRTRMTQEFTDYRRFITGARVVGAPTTSAENSSVA
jgi:hypothetical protein